MNFTLAEGLKFVRSIRDCTQHLAFHKTLFSTKIRKKPKVLGFCRNLFNDVEFFVYYGVLGGCADSSNPYLLDTFFILFNFN